MRYWTLLAALLLTTCVAFAQSPDLEADNAEIITRLDAFGLEQQVLIGTLINNSNTAYENINIFAEFYDEDDNLIGEGFGFVVDQCGEAILDFPLQPDGAQQFVTTVDIFEEGEIDRFEIIPEGTETEPEERIEVDTIGVTQISNREVVNVQWESDTILRYGVGCVTQVFTTYDWSRYSLETEQTIPLDAHPAEEFITDAFIRQTGINQITQSRATDETLFNASHLEFPTQTERVVFQNDIANLYTSQRDGSFRRLIITFISRYNLQGYIWSPLGNFTAYYYGAYGDPVLYMTASAQGQLISDVLADTNPSVTVPGMYNDGTATIIGSTFDGITGYYLSDTRVHNRELLFEVDELPGNNYPAPAYYFQQPNNRYMYIIRPVDGQNVLQCYYKEGNELTTLTPLPLQLDTDERAHSWLSPDFNWLAIAADGDHSGLWLVDLNAFDACR